MKFKTLVSFFEEGLANPNWPPQSEPEGPPSEISMYDLSSGFARDKKAIGNVRTATLGKHLIKTKDGTLYRVIGPLRSTQMLPGVKFLGSYNQTNQGADVYEFVGFTDIKKAHSDTPVFSSLKEVFAAYPEAGGKLSTLENIDKIKGLGYGHNVYMVVKDLDDGDQGGWFYLFNGRWSRGSGAEPMSFYRVEEVNKQPAPDVPDDLSEPFDHAERQSGNYNYPK